MSTLAGSTSSDSVTFCSTVQWGVLSPLWWVQSEGNAKLCQFVKLRFSGARRSLAPYVHCHLPLQVDVILALTQHHALIV